MKPIEQNKKRYEKAMDIVKDIQYIVNDIVGRDVVLVDGLDGDEKDPSSLIVIDVYSFTTFPPLAKKAFMDALDLADAVNFSALSNDMVRIVMSFLDTYEQHEFPTQVFSIHTNNEN